MSAALATVLKTLVFVPCCLGLSSGQNSHFFFLCPPICLQKAHRRSQLGLLIDVLLEGGVFRLIGHSPDIPATSPRYLSAILP